MTHSRQPVTMPTLPLYRISEPLSQLIAAQGESAWRRIDQVIHRHRVRRRGLDANTLKPAHRDLDTPAGTIELSIQEDGNTRVASLFAKLILSPRTDFAMTEFVLRGVILPQTTMAACIGRPLSDVIDTDEAFPARHATIVGARRTALSTRLKLDVAMADAFA